MDPNMFFAKIHEFALLAVKCKPTPVPAKLAGTCAKSKIYL
jgi:hypothetical protein